jgi:hypothetical protein
MVPVKFSVIVEPLLAGAVSLPLAIDCVVIAGGCGTAPPPLLPPPQPATAMKANDAKEPIARGVMRSLCHGGALGASMTIVPF